MPYSPDYQCIASYANKQIGTGSNNSVQVLPNIEKQGLSEKLSWNRSFDLLSSTPGYISRYHNTNRGDWGSWYTHGKIVRDTPRKQTTNGNIQTQTTRAQRLGWKTGRIYHNSHGLLGICAFHQFCTRLLRIPLIIDQKPFEWSHVFCIMNPVGDYWATLVSVTCSDSWKEFRKHFLTFRRALISPQGPAWKPIPSVETTYQDGWCRWPTATLTLSRAFHQIA